MKDNHNYIGIVLIVSFVFMLGPFSIDTYLPSFQSIESEFLSSRAMMQQTIALYLMATAIATLFWGPLSDRIGRKRVITITLVLYSIASFSCALASDYKSFLFFRILQGVVASGGLVAGRAMVRDIYSSHGAQKIMAYVLMLFALAPAVAPVVGGWLHESYGWRSIFYFLTAYGLLMLGVVSFLLHESLHQKKRQSFHPVKVLGVYLQTFLHIKFVFIVLALGSSFGGFFIYIAGAPTIMFNILHLSSTDFWIQFVPMTAGIILGSLIANKLIDFWGAKNIIYLAFAVMFVGMLVNVLQAYLLSPGVFWVITPVVIYALGVAMSMPGLGVMALDCFPKNKGAASAVQSFVQIMFSGLVAGVMLPMIPHSVKAYALLQLVLLCAGIVFWVVSHLADINFNEKVKEWE